jgi:ABC-type sugar transport system, periplasmic component
MRKVIALLLVCTFILTGFAGCNKKEKQTDLQTNVQSSEASGQKSGKAAKNDPTATGAKMGRYMETKVNLPDLEAGESIIKILENSAKQIEMYTSAGGKHYCYTMKKDMTWDKSEPAWLINDKLAQKGAVLSSICLGEDGNYYAAYTIYYQDVRSHIFKSSDGGKTAQEIKIPYLNKQKIKKTFKYRPIIKDIKVLKNGNLVLFEMQSPKILQIFSPKGEKLNKIPIHADNFNIYLKAYGNDIIIAAEDNRSIIFYNTDSKQVDRTIEYEVKSYPRAFAVKEDGTVLMGDTSGIHRIQKNGTLWETPVDGILNSMNLPTTHLNELFVTEGGEEEYYASYKNDDSSYQLMHYVYDKNVPAVPTHEITVYSLQENKTIRQAISLFQIKNTDVRVNYIVAMGLEGGTVSDYIRALNTELLAGNGADVLLLDGLPVDSYLQKGVLADFSDIIKLIEASGELLSNIANCYAVDGKVYQMPLRFGVPLIVGKQDALSSVNKIDDIISYITKNKEIPYSSSTSYRSLLQNYLALYSKQFYKDGLLDKKQLVSFLNNLKMIADNTKAMETNKENDLTNSNTDFIDSDTLFYGDPLGIICGKFSSDMVQVTNYTSLIVPEALNEKDGMDIAPINQLYVPKGMVGLNKASKDTVLAKQFISFLFSEEAQSADLNNGFPINMKSLEKWAAEERPGFMNGYADTEGNSINGEWPTKEVRESFLKTIQGLTTPVEINQIVDSIIIKETLPFFTGKISVEQAADTVESKINTYLSE